MSRHKESGKSIRQARNANTVLSGGMALAEELSCDGNPAGADSQVAAEKAITSLPAVPHRFLGSLLPSFPVSQAALGS